MRRRQGFTLVELLVAMALIIFIMAILSQAFVAATTTFRNLKAAGDMANKLRATTQLLQHDLAADHFEGRRRLSDENFWDPANLAPPQQGFFRIWQGSPGVAEGNDLATVGSFRSVDHALAFTIKLRGNQMSDFLSANAPALSGLTTIGPNEARYQSNTYNYQWAEVAWYMLPSINPATGQQDTTAADRVNPAAGPPVPLYTLYRRQRLAVPDNSVVTPVLPASAANLAATLEASCWPNGGNLYFNSPIDLTVPSRRFGMDPNNPAGVPLGGAYPTLQSQGAPANLVGADIQLTDVVSFDVRLRLVSNGVRLNDPFLTLFDAPINSPLSNPSFGAAKVLDTWTSVKDNLGDYSQWNTGNKATTIPLRNKGIDALQISIRIWDSKTNQTRQVTMIQAM